MSNRQARREQMRANRQQRAAQRPPTQRPSRTPSPGGPSRRRSGGGLPGPLGQPFVWLVGLVVIAAIGALVAVIVLRDSDSDELVSKLTEAHDNFPADMVDGAFVGDPNAPLTLTSYEDFQCPFCLLYTANQEPGIIEEFVKSGQVRLEFKHLPILGTESLRAARAGVCAAEQNVFWDFQNAIFTKQAEEDQVGNEQIDVGRLSDDALRDFAVDAGADGAEYDACFADQASLDKVQADQTEASSFGISGTPGFALNGVPLGGGTPSDIEGWRTIFESFLADLEASPTASPSPTGTASPAPTATPTN
jgi:protein-disulfide isomerase